MAEGARGMARSIRAIGAVRALGAGLVRVSTVWRRARRRANLHQAARAIAGDGLRVRHRPVEAFVEIVSDCNIRCTMCALSFDPIYRRGPQDYRGKMTREVFERALPLLTRAVKVHLMGTGEPTMHPDLGVMVTSLTRRGAWVTFNTNGTLLDAGLADRLLDAGLPHMVVSLDGARRATYERIRRGARLTAVLANVRGLVARREARGLRHPELAVAMVLLRDNAEEIGELAEVAAGFGARTLHVEPLLWQDDPCYQPYYDAQAVPEAEARARLEEAGVRARAAGIALASPLLDRGAVALGDRSQPGPPCSEPWTTVFITREGQLRPCCNTAADLGRLRAGVSPMGAEAWNSERFRAYRRQLAAGAFPEGCTACARNGRYRRTLSTDAAVLGVAADRLPPKAR